MRIAMIGVAALCALIVIAAVAVPEGEIATLNVIDEEGHPHPIQLWRVEIDGTSYLRATDPGADWLLELRRQPAVTLGAGLHAGEIPVPVFAEVVDTDPDLRRRVTAAMARKYGVADRIWAAIRGRDVSVPVRLVPRPAETAS